MATAHRSYRLQLRLLATCLGCTPLLAASQTSINVSLDESCSARRLLPSDLTANAIVPSSDSCVLSWTASEIPVSSREQVTLYFGQPGEVIDLKREPIVFSPGDGGDFVAARRFSRDELGTHSFVTVLVTSRDEILNWTAWTVRATELPDEPPPAANQSLDIRVGAVRLDTANGTFPRSRQTDGVAWAAAKTESNGYELDSDDTGAPGVRVTVSQAWTPTDLAAGSVREALASRLDDALGIDNRNVRMEDLVWQETQPDLIRYEEATELFERRHYYSVVTIWTDATARPLGAREPSRYAHETSVSEWPAREVQEWASYIRGEYTADPELLTLIADYARDKRAIPGFSHKPDTRGGDGGVSTFSLRFIARLRPWAPIADGIADENRFSAGIESFAVVGTRTGLGTSEIVQEAGEQHALCNSFGLLCGDTRAEAASLPEGWFREASSSHALDSNGNIPIVYSPPQIAQYYASRGGSLLDLRNVLAAQYRGILKGAIVLRSEENRIILADEGGHAIEVGANIPQLSLQQLPNRAYFILSARLRAGALVRREGVFAKRYRMIPVNPYVQFVVRTTVIKDLATVLTGAPARDVQNPAVMGKDQPIVKPPSWFNKLLDTLIALPRVLLGLLLAIPALALIVGLTRLFTRRSK